jgi:hypothetical protein
MQFRERVNEHFYEFKESGEIAFNYALGGAHELLPGFNFDE